MDKSPGIRLQLTLLIIILKQHSADSNVCRDSFPVFHHALTGHVLKTVTKDTFSRCIFSCELNPQCYSVNFHAKRKSCEFNLGTVEAFQADLVQRKESVYISMVVRHFNPCIIAEPCRNGGSCQPYPVTRCICPAGFSGPLCEVPAPMALGLASGYIGDGDLTASTYKPGCEPWRARLHGTSYWRPDTDDTNQYFTVFLYEKINLTAIATQGAVNETCWITAFTLDAALNNTWIKYKENNVVKSFIGNKDENSVVKHELEPLEVTVVRLYPSEWHQCIALRMELYGNRVS
ncbi:hypothetical protein ACROYT_G026947 [Oculina patagonica]